MLVVIMLILIFVLLFEQINVFLQVSQQEITIS